MNKSFFTGQLILASSSPRRRELLSQAGYSFTVVPPRAQEPSGLDISSPVEYAEYLAHFKAADVARLHRQDIVLGADTIVACNGRILGKARDAEDARAMLSELSAVRHVVITAIALLGPGQARTVCSAETHVTMKPMSASEIDAYVRSGEWQDKAGAYAIQETADRFVVKLEGSKSNVVGLPVELLEQMLKNHGTG